MIIADSIKNYIIYLRKECALAVTLHISGLPEELISFNIHDNPYCICVKSNPAAHRYCIECQKKVNNKAISGTYTGVCHAGVKEFVYPVSCGNRHIGFISVSGYKTDNSDEFIKKTAEKFALSTEKLTVAYNQLKAEIPDKKRVDTLIVPLLAMLELRLSESDSAAQKNPTFGERIVNYLIEHRNEDITSEDICSRFSCSRSYVSREFNRQTGKTIRQYLTELRIADAKILLKSSGLSITEIAFTVGYGDSNYFSNLFKKQVGISPKEYRNKNY